MTHDEAVGWLPGWIEGRLSGTEDVRVRDHVDGCEDCRSLAEGYRVIAGVLRSDAARGPGSHPPSEALVAFATGLTAIDPADHLRVAQHVGACAACAADVDATRAAERAHSMPAGEEALPFRASRRPSWRALAAASVAIGALAVGYPVYRAVVRSGGANASASHRAVWGGVVGLPVVSGTLRGDADSVATIEAPADRPIVAFALSVPADLDIPATTALSVTLVGASGEEVWHETIAPGRLPALAGRAGAVLVVVPSSRLTPGEFVVRLSRSGDLAAAPLLEAPLRVVR